LTPFLDASALVKRYISEPGSMMVRDLFRRVRPAVTRISYAELAASIARAAREGVIEAEQRDSVLDRLDADFAELTVIEVRRSLVERVPVLVVRHPLRGYDAVQLAAALAVREHGAAVTFWSADEALTAAARVEGLRAVVPGD